MSSGDKDISVSFANNDAPKISEISLNLNQIQDK